MGNRAGQIQPGVMLMQSSWPLRRRDTDTWARGKLAQNGSSRANEKDIKRERLAWRGWLKLMGSLSGGVGSSGLAVRAIFNGFCLPLRTQHITVSLFCMAKVKPRCLTVRSSCHLPQRDGSACSNALLAQCLLYRVRVWLWDKGWCHEPRAASSLGVPD